MGGGICQVSSTLYNTVLMADLKIVKRTNHSMPVGYVPAGRDATVSYGTIDFVFENDKTYPVKICSTSANRTLTISIEGISDMDYTVDLYTETVSTRPFTTREVYNEALAPEQTRVIQSGTNGATVYTYKIYKRDGVQFDKKLVGKSTYNPIEKIVETGVKPDVEDDNTEDIAQDVTAEEITPEDTTITESNTVTDNTEVPEPDDTTDTQNTETIVETNDAEFESVFEEAVVSNAEAESDKAIIENDGINAEN